MGSPISNRVPGIQREQSGRALGGQRESEGPGAPGAGQDLLQPPVIPDEAAGAEARALQGGRPRGPGKCFCLAPS